MFDHISIFSASVNQYKKHAGLVGGATVGQEEGEQEKSASQTFSHDF